MMSMSFVIATTVALIAADDAKNPGTVVEGHAIRIETASSNAMPPGPNRKAVKNVSLTFAVEPKDAKKSFAYEIGQRHPLGIGAGSVAAWMVLMLYLTWMSWVRGLRRPDAPR